jgi:hypothetical protein
MSPRPSILSSLNNTYPEFGQVGVRFSQLMVSEFRCKWLFRVINLSAIVLYGVRLIVWWNRS